jgi:glycine cleavage system H protein
MQQCKGYEIRTDVYYHSDSNMWVEPISPNKVRVGFDPLGVEINGTLAQISLSDPPLSVRAGSTVGSLEAEKFVGPVQSPLSGTVTAVNRVVLADPKLVYGNCFAAWLFEVELEDVSELEALVAPGAAYEDFSARVDSFRKAGVLAW